MPDFVFNPAAYGPVVAGLLSTERVPVLGPGSPVSAARAKLRAFDPKTGLGRPVTDTNAARACHSGLCLLFDHLDESHSISQDLHTSEGSFWHAVMHRREPDAWNSKYWWRKVGSHPVIDTLAELSPSLGVAYRSPFDFVDLCERVRGTGTSEEDLSLIHI